MARADYAEQLHRHTGEWDVLPNGLPVPIVDGAAVGRGAACAGSVELAEAVLEGNRWGAVSGALLAESALRCATIAAMTSAVASRPRAISVRFRKMIPVADARSRPHVADGAATLHWGAEVVADDTAAVAVRMHRVLPGAAEPVLTVDARASFEPGPHGPRSAAELERRIRAYLAALPTRLALPAYQSPWTRDTIRGACKERPGSLVGVAEQALGDAGKIVRGDGVPEDEDESMLLADMTYRWLAPLDDACVTYEACAGERRRDERGRTWVDARATLFLGDEIVGEATGAVVLHRTRCR